jgi:hypothetical protein
MPKSLHEMDEQELGALLEQLSQTVERLAHEKPGSGEYTHKVGLLRDVRQLLAARQKRKEASDK